MFHTRGLIFHGGMKRSTEVLKHATEVSNIPRIRLNISLRYDTFHARGLKIPRGYHIFHGVGKIFHGGIKYSTEGVKHSTEVLNVPRRYQIFHGGG